MDLSSLAGDGATCTPTPQVQQLEDQYATEATQGPLICDIRYPINAPGFQYDPTGALEMDNFASGKQVRSPPYDSQRTV